jgi:GntR family transcriptional regulator
MSIKGGGGRSARLSGIDQVREGTRPLYAQVRDLIVRRLVEGQWSPGDVLPSEIELAQEIGVSQGTVRKALDAMAAEHLVVRRHGRGTFVARHDEQRILFQFFKMKPDAGAPAFPESRALSVEIVPAGPEEAQRLSLPPGAPVLRLRRVRSLAGRPAVAETVTVPASLFPGLEKDIPNNLYGLYATHYGITIAQASENLKAVLLAADDAALLDVAPGTPALLIDRTASALDGTLVEWRVSLCLTDHYHYSVDLK